MCDENNDLGFVHLHDHSEYSTLDGMGRIEEMVLAAKAHGQSSFALTDHGTTSGLWEFQQTCLKHGVKPILGNEFYYQRENDSKNGHLLVLAKNNAGLKNIFKLQEYSYVHNFYYKPRIDWEILKYHSEGLITTSTCLGSAFNQMLIKGDVLEATKWARKFKEVFQGDFYMEIQPNDIPEQFIANEGAIRIAKQLNIPLVATNDVHYTQENDCFPHEVLLAMQTKKKMSDDDRFKFPAEGFHIKSEQEMIDTFSNVSKDDLYEALRNTAVIAEKCNARIEVDNYLPKFYSIPDGKTERDLLVEKVMEGARDKQVATNKEYMREVQEEIEVIDRNGYSGYFVIVQDYVTSARKNNIIAGDGRGSGAGSKVAYLSDITRIEPKTYNLLFERFMADGRTPDFDVDFSDQDAVFEDLQRKYGVENVARIISFGRMTPKAVTRKVLNTFEVPQFEIGRITKMIDEFCPSMDEAFKNSDELCKVSEKYKLEFEVIMRLENVISHESQHAGGVIIYPNIGELLPIKSLGKDRNKRIVGWDMDMLKDVGHYKFDVLGLKTLPVVRNTIDSIKNVTGEIVDIDNINLEDQETYDMLCKGDVSGVFQINAQSNKTMEQQPRNFRDIIAINALIRPGVGDWSEYIARRKGKEWNKDPNRPWMHETLGTFAYQEQYMLDGHILAGWAIADCDKWLRKNKDIRNDVDLKEKFIWDGRDNGYDDEYLNDVWKEIEDAVDGGYGFPKAHATSYGKLLFQTAYLKCHYPEHFYASQMTSDGDDQDAIAGYVAECKQRGITIVPPDINHSDSTFRVIGDTIAYRITTIKHVGESAINNILALRPIQSFNDFMDRREKKHIKKNVLVNLIKAGCFDFDNENRAELLWEVDMSNRSKTQIKEEFQCDKYEWNDKIKAEWEKDALGLYLSVHPMEKYGFKPLDSYADNSECVIGGEVLDVAVIKDRKGNEMAFVMVDTLFGNVKVIVFSYAWAREADRAPYIVGENVIVTGKRSGGDVLHNKVEVLE